LGVTGFRPALYLNAAKLKIRTGGNGVEAYAGDALETGSAVVKHKKGALDCVQRLKGLVQYVSRRVCEVSFGRGRGAKVCEGLQHAE
jgi:hypothetical protein